MQQPARRPSTGGANTDRPVSPRARPPSMGRTNAVAVTAAAQERALKSHLGRVPPSRNVPPSGYEKQLTAPPEGKTKFATFTNDDAYVASPRVATRSQLRAERRAEFAPVRPRAAADAAAAASTSSSRGSKTRTQLLKKRRRSKEEHLLRRYDINGDGKVDPIEVAIVSLIDAHDGHAEQLTQAELEQAAVLVSGADDPARAKVMQLPSQDEALSLIQGLLGEYTTFKKDGVRIARAPPAPPGRNSPTGAYVDRPRWQSRVDMLRELRSERVAKLRDQGASRCTDWPESGPSLNVFDGYGDDAAGGAARGGSEGGGGGGAEAHKHAAKQALHDALAGAAERRKPKAETSAGHSSEGLAKGKESRLEKAPTVVSTRNSSAMNEFMALGHAAANTAKPPSGSRGSMMARRKVQRQATGDAFQEKRFAKKVNAAQLDHFVMQDGVTVAVADGAKRRGSTGAGAAQADHLGAGETFTVAADAAQHEHHKRRFANGAAAVDHLGTHAAPDMDVPGGGGGVDENRHHKAMFKGRQNVDHLGAHAAPDVDASVPLPVEHHKGSCVHRDDRDHTWDVYSTSADSIGFQRTARIHQSITNTRGFLTPGRVGDEV